MKRIDYHAGICLLAALLLLGSMCKCSAQNYTRDSLKGIQAIGVLVEMDDDATKEGFVTEDIKTETELRLRKAGIKVIDMDKDFHTTPYIGYLYLNLHVISDSDVFIYSGEVKFVQPVFIERLKSIYPSASTWGKFVLGTAHSKNTAPLMDSAARFVDAFANDYLAANPKKSSANTTASVKVAHK